MDEADVKPRDIKAALSIDDPELARMRAVYRTVPLDIIEAIGRAPKVGRPRWAEFAKVFSEQAELHEDLRSALSEATAKRQASDQKFLAAFNALRSSQSAQTNDKPIASAGGKSSEGSCEPKKICVSLPAPLRRRISLVHRGDATRVGRTLRA